MGDPTAKRRKLTDLVPDPHSANLGTERGLRMLEDSLREDGIGRGIVVDRNGKTIGGRHVLESAVDLGFEHAIVVPTDGKTLVVTQRVDVDADSPQGRRMALRDNRVGQVDLDWSTEEFQALKDKGVKLDDLFYEDELPLPEEDEAPLIGEPTLTRDDVPDALWPSDNQYGIPVLDLNLQANAFDAPILAYGERARTTKHKGCTLHFYVEDYRFAALWADPTSILRSEAVTVVEPNTSIYTDMPFAVALYQIYRKRWLARWWQSIGLRVVVDLNIAERYYDLALLGVPRGWSWYATRGYTDRMDNTVQEYELARQLAAGNTVNFLVYGGGKQVQALCIERGWLWAPEQRDAAKEKANGKG